MFIQIMQGKCTRQDELRALNDEWIRDLSPGATGWLGGTYGFTDDDMFIGVIRFESRDAAMANSERPEQGAFAERMGELMDGPMEFHDSEDVTLLLDGGSDDAGFVQVIRGKVDDPARLKSILANADGLREMRPDIVGASLAVEPDGTFTETVAFTSEEAARSGEQVEPPEEMRDDLEYTMKDAKFYDLRNPWFSTA
jgi:ribosomal protein S6E (S10)